MGKVKCADCGLVGLRVADTRSLIETEQGTRESGSLPAVEVDGEGDSPFSTRKVNVVDPYPVCLARVANFHKEMGKQTDSITRLEVLQTERDCSDFQIWHVGLTPREHVEMLAIREQREWQQKQERFDRRWRILELVVMGLIVTAVSVGAQIASAFIERGSLFPDPRPPAVAPVDITH